MKAEAEYERTVDRHRTILKLCTPPHQKVAIAGRAVDTAKKMHAAAERKCKELEINAVRAEAAAQAQQQEVLKADISLGAAESDLHAAQMERAAVTAAAAGSVLASSPSPPTGAPGGAASSTPTPFSPHIVMI